MPTIEVETTMHADPERIWAAVTAVEDYPRFMADVHGVRVEEELPGDERLTSWSVELKGSVLEWTERETVRHDVRRLEFVQVHGDLDRFAGAWTVGEAADGRATVRFEVDFDIGIPLLADMLNPVAARALEQNSRRMLEAIEREVAP